MFTSLDSGETQMTPMQAQRAKYAEKAKGMTEAALEYAIKDVRETLDCHTDSDPFSGYCGRLWSEFEAYTEALKARQKWAA